MSVVQKTVRILVADDHRLVREGIRAMLPSSSPFFRYEVEEAETTEEAMVLARSRGFDVVLMDYRLQGVGGDKATRWILDHCPGVRVVALSAYDERPFVERMVRAGAMGYLLKNIGPDTLVAAIRSVLDGRPFYSNEVALRLMDGRMNPATPSPLDRLTRREREVFSLILAGWKNIEIAGRLAVDKRTVDKHRQNLMRKLGTRNALELVQAGVSWGYM